MQPICPLIFYDYSFPECVCNLEKFFRVSECRKFVLQKYILLLFCPLKWQIFNVWGVTHPHTRLSFTPAHNSSFHYFVTYHFKSLKKRLNWLTMRCLCSNFLYILREFEFPRPPKSMDIRSGEHRRHVPSFSISFCTKCSFSAHTVVIFPCEGVLEFFLSLLNEGLPLIVNGPSQSYRIYEKL